MRGPGLPLWIAMPSALQSVSGWSVMIRRLRGSIGRGVALGLGVGVGSTGGDTIASERSAAEVTEHAVSAPAPKPAPARAMKRRRETLDIRTTLPNPRRASHQLSLNDHAGTAVR